MSWFSKPKKEEPSDEKVKAKSDLIVAKVIDKTIEQVQKAHTIVLENLKVEHAKELSALSDKVKKEVTEAYEILLNENKQTLSAYRTKIEILEQEKNNLNTDIQNLSIKVQQLNDEKTRIDNERGSLQLEKHTWEARYQENRNAMKEELSRLRSVQSDEIAQSLSERKAAIESYYQNQINENNALKVENKRMFLELKRIKEENPHIVVNLHLKKTEFSM